MGCADAGEGDFFSMAVLLTFLFLHLFQLKWLEGDPA
jgi:hypothetical protein